MSFYVGGSPVAPMATPRPYTVSQDHANGFAISQKLDGILALFAEQKDILCETKEVTSLLKKKVDSLNFEIEDLKEKIESNSKASIARPKRIPRELSEAVKGLHDHSDDTDQFDGSESYSSERNHEVQQFIYGQIHGKFNKMYSPKRMKRAVHRYYESRRRLFLESQPNRVDDAKRTKQKSRNAALRKQSYDRRKKFLRKEKEREKWSQIDHRYMTEESDSDSVIRQHKLTWRSETLSRLIKKLDKRHADQTKQGQFKFKPRELSVPSTVTPPPDCPSWASQNVNEQSSVNSSLCEE